MLFPIANLIGKKSSGFRLIADIKAMLFSTGGRPSLFPRNPTIKYLVDLDF